MAALMVTADADLSAHRTRTNRRQESAGVIQPGRCLECGAEVHDSEDFARHVLSGHTN